MEVDKTIGAIGWMDLTVKDADATRDFYSSVVGWKTESISMGDYKDYCMLSPEDGIVRTGICNAKGENAGIPAQWIMYINVKNLDESINAVEQGGGKVVNGPRDMGESRFCIIEDPAGACVGLFQHG